jgi:hypothetical protein
MFSPPFSLQFLKSCAVQNSSKWKAAGIRWGGGRRSHMTLLPRSLQWEALACLTAASESPVLFIGATCPCGLWQPQGNSGKPSSFMLSHQNWANKELASCQDVLIILAGGLSLHVASCSPQRRVNTLGRWGWWPEQRHLGLVGAKDVVWDFSLFEMHYVNWEWGRM